MSTHRQTNLDILRIFAATSVIFLHINFDASQLKDIENYLKTLLRWCVPVFFLMSGYFLRGASLDEAVSVGRISRIAKITLAISLLYAPFFSFNGPGTALDLIFSGVWFHLWFLHALIASLLFLKVYDRFIGSKQVLWLLSAAILIGLSMYDFQVAHLNEATPRSFVMFRFLQGIPLIFTGYVLRQKNFSFGPTVGALSVLFGTMLCLAEEVLLLKLGAGDVTPQFPLGTLPMAFGMFFIFKNWTVSSARPTWLFSDLSTYSLQIYLLHPFVLAVLKKLLSLLSVSPEGIFTGQMTLGVALSLSIPKVISTFTPPLSRFLSGNWEVFRQHRDIR